MSLTTLKAGDSLPVTKGDGTPISKIRIELSWNEDGPRSPYDFDAYTIEVNSKAGGPAGKMVSDSRVCYFGKKDTPAMKHSGDNLTGAGEGADEVIKLDLSLVDSNTDQVPVFVSLYQAASRGQNFQQTKGAEVVIVDESTNQPLAKAVLADLVAGSTSAAIACFERDGSGWKFSSVNQGYAGKEISDIFKLYS